MMLKMKALNNLHSTMVLLKYKLIVKIETTAIRSTFHYGSIKMDEELEEVVFLINLHSTMVLLKYIIPYFFLCYIHIYIPLWFY